jgi:hypothetical protein
VKRPDQLSETELAAMFAAGRYDEIENARAAGRLADLARMSATDTEGDQR